ncbi:MAG: Acetate kinase, partial [uncultured Gemmatimonadaceae bacterium]
ERPRAQRRLVDAQVPARAHRRRAHGDERRREARPRPDRADRRRGDRDARRRRAGRGAIHRAAAGPARRGRPRDLAPRHRGRRTPERRRDRGGRAPRGARGRALPALGARGRRGGPRDRGDDRPRPAPQPGQPPRDRRDPRHARPRRPAGGGVRHRVPPHAPRARVPLRAPLPALPAPPRAALRLPRHLAPLRRAPLPAAHRHRARRHPPRHPPPRQRLLGLRDRRRRLDRHVDGVHAARGARDGHALGRRRPGDPRLRGREGGAVARRGRDAAQQAIRPARRERPHERHARAPGRGRGVRGPARAARDRDLLLPRAQVRRRLPGRGRRGERGGVRRRGRRERRGGSRAHLRGARVGGAAARPRAQPRDRGGTRGPHQRRRGRARGVGDPDRRGTAHRARQLPRRHGRRVAVL